MVIKNDEIKLDNLGDGVSRKILSHSGNMMSVEVHFEKGSIGALHSHVHEQVSYILKGSFELELDGKKHIVKVGDTYYTKPNVLHGVVALEDSALLDIFTPQREDFLK